MPFQSSGTMRRENRNGDLKHTTRYGIPWLALSSMRRTSSVGHACRNRVAGRAVREVAQRSRAAARRLGLGSVVEIELEGATGSLLVLPHEAGVAAVQSSAAQLPEALRPALLALAHAQVEGTEAPRP